MLGGGVITGQWQLIDCREGLDTEASQSRRNEDGVKVFLRHLAFNIHYWRGTVEDGMQDSRRKSEDGWKILGMESQTQVYEIPGEIPSGFELLIHNMTSWQSLQIVNNEMLCQSLSLAR